MRFPIANESPFCGAALEAVLPRCFAFPSRNAGLFRHAIRIASATEIILRADSNALTAAGGLATVYDSAIVGFSYLRLFNTSSGNALSGVGILCGRFTLKSPAADWCQLLLPDLTPQELPFSDPPRYNIAPTQPIVCVLRESVGDPRQAVHARWGLIPPWADDPSIGNRMINARGETVDTKASFKKPLASRRCLIPADGYYEWMKTEDGKQPYLMSRSDGGPFAMAGLWESNRRVADDGTAIRSCTIITTDSNQATSHLHDRMPVILDPNDYDRWLDPGFRDAEALKRLLVPAPEELLTTMPVSRHVNNPRHEDPKCVEPI